MAVTVDKLINDERFCGDNLAQFLLYLPLGLFLLLIRVFLALVLWVASIILPNKSTVRQLLSTLACWTFGVYVNVKGEKDPRCSVMVANYVSCLDSLAASHVLGTISLRKWKVPPFFASTLGIRNAAQFVRKQHFADCPSKPVLLQPEGGPTNGKGLLKFTDWPFQIGNKVQPVAISVERALTRVTVHRGGGGGGGGGGERFPWADALWFLCAPVTLYTVTLLPAVERRAGDCGGDGGGGELAARARAAIADCLQVELTEYRWEELARGAAAARREPSPAAARLARQVKEVLPRVPMRDILRDLAITRSVDVTITNFLEGVTPYTPEPEAARAPGPGPGPAPAAGAEAEAGPSRAPPPAGVFARSARDRQLGFRERKAAMVADARRRYMQKHGLDAAAADRR